MAAPMESRQTAVLMGGARSCASVTGPDTGTATARSCASVTGPVTGLGLPSSLLISTAAGTVTVIDSPDRVTGIVVIGRPVVGSSSTTAWGASGRVGPGG